jgi:hypothetical protein
MDNRIVVITALFILLIVLCLDYFVREEFQLLNETGYSYVDPQILEARNTGKHDNIHRGELTNLRSGDKIQAIKVINRFGGEKKTPDGFDGLGPHSKDLTYYQDYSSDYPVIKDNEPEPTITSNIPMVTGPMVTGPMVTGPMVTGPMVTGPMDTGR